MTSQKQSLCSQLPIQVQIDLLRHAPVAPWDTTSAVPSAVISATAARARRPSVREFHEGQGQTIPIKGRIYDRSRPSCRQLPLLVSAYLREGPIYA